MSNEHPASLYQSTRPAATPGLLRLEAKRAFDHAVDWLEQERKYLTANIELGMGYLREFASLGLPKRDRLMNLASAEGRMVSLDYCWDTLQHKDGAFMVSLLERTLDLCKPYQGDYLARFEQRLREEPENMATFKVQFREAMAKIEADQSLQVEGRKPSADAMRPTF